MVPTVFPSNKASSSGWLCPSFLQLNGECLLCAILSREEGNRSVPNNPQPTRQVNKWKTVTDYLMATTCFLLVTVPVVGACWNPLRFLLYFYPYKSSYTLSLFFYISLISCHITPELKILLNQQKTIHLLYRRTQSLKAARRLFLEHITPIASCSHRFVLASWSQGLDQHWGTSLGQHMCVKGKVGVTLCVRASQSEAAWASNHMGNW